MFVAGAQKPEKDSSALTKAMNRSFIALSIFSIAKGGCQQITGDSGELGHKLASCRTSVMTLLINL
jgi:hypothetical protein